MNKRKPSLKDRIIKKLGGYTAAEYNMLTMPVPIIKVETATIEKISARTVLYDARNFSGVKVAEASVRYDLSKQLGRQALEFAEINRKYDPISDIETYTAEVKIVNRRATDE